MEPCHPFGGQLRWYSTTKIPLVNDRDETIGIAGISRDLTEIHDARELLEARVAERTAELGVRIDRKML